MKDIVEIFGYGAGDTSSDAKLFWKTKACPFLGTACSKTNHDGSFVYGTCSVSSSHGNIIICPKRLYADGYQTLQTVAENVFGKCPFLTFPEYLAHRKKSEPILKARCGVVVALGQQSGREISLGNQMSMDWVLVHIKQNKIASYTGVEVQSIDITGNYRDNCHWYHQWRERGKKPTSPKPTSKHGYNWANVHKRLIPQIIRKGLVYSRSENVTHGLSFILPDEVFKRFEQVLGSGFAVPTEMSNSVLTIYTYQLGDDAGAGVIRPLVHCRTIQVTLSEFSERFVTGPNLPTGSTLDSAVSVAVGLEFLR